MAMETFPSYDFPLWGNTPESTSIGTAPIEGSEDMPFGENYGGMGAKEIFKTKNVIPVPPFTIGTVATDFAGGVTSAVAVPVKAVKDTLSSVYSSVSGTIRNTFLYGIGGIVILGILAIVLLGAGTKFAGKVQGI
jgi:hypothetical protein